MGHGDVVDWGNATKATLAVLVMFGVLALLTKLPMSVAPS